MSLTKKLYESAFFDSKLTKFDVKSNYLNKDSYACFINYNHVNFYFEYDNQIINSFLFFKNTYEKVDKNTKFKMSYFPNYFSDLILEKDNKNFYEYEKITQDLFDNLMKIDEIRFKSLFSFDLGDILYNYYVSIKQKG